MTITELNTILTWVLIAFAIVWALIEIEKMRMKRYYCLHCNERIIYRNEQWQTKAQINPHMNMGDPTQCISGIGHRPR